MDISQERLCEFYGKNAGLRFRGHSFVGACAIETRMDNSQDLFCVEIDRKCQTPIPRPSCCASKRSGNAHGHFTRAILCGNLQGKCLKPRLPPRLNTGGLTVSQQETAKSVIRYKQERNVKNICMEWGKSYGYGHGTSVAARTRSDSAS